MKKKNRLFADNPRSGIWYRWAADDLIRAGIGYDDPEWEKEMKRVDALYKEHRDAL